MKLQQAFDQYAEGYDADFTHTATGQAQRKQVWKALEPCLKSGSDILEINCGAGEDAIRLSQMGFKVLATDISPEMIRVAGGKKLQAGVLNLTLMQAGFLELGQKLAGSRFDLIFSNFGGLNCLSPDETRGLAPVFHELLNPGGRLFLVYMSKYCLWENAYFRLKGQPEAAVRRHSGYATAAIGGEQIGVWYYTPNELETIFSPHFRKLKVRPVGLFAPPSYLEHYFSKRQTLLKFLEWTDGLLNFPLAADYADHFVVIFEKL